MPNDTPIKDALDKLGTSGDGFTVIADVSEKSKTVGAEVSVSPGNWTLSAAWQYTKDLGHAALGKVTWRPKGKE
jgi:succinylarginine dihydrolase